MAVEIDQVEGFVAIVRRGGFTRAATALRLSQPAVSRQVTALVRRRDSVEEELRVGTLRALRIAAMRLSVPIVLVHHRRAYLSGAARALVALLAERPSPVRT